MSKIWDALKKAELERDPLIAEPEGVDVPRLLSAKQRAAVEAILAHTTLAEASAACGVTQKTLERWLRTPAFLTAYQVASFRKEDGQTYNSTFITSDLRSVIDGLHDMLNPAKRNEGMQKSRQLGLIFLSFFAGAVAAAYLSPRIYNHTLWFADVLLAAVIVLVLTKSRAAAFH